MRRIIQINLAHDAAGAAFAVVEREDVNANSSDGYETLKRVLREAHPNWKEKCNLRRTIDKRSGEKERQLGVGGGLIIASSKHLIVSLSNHLSLGTLACEL